MERVFSGVQSSGAPHVGNYFGAFRQWVADQHTADSVFCVVDLHALTVETDPAQVRGRTLETASWLFASGLDPDVCIVFAQSHVHEHTGLSWLLECTATFGELRRMTQFKEKSRQHEDNINAGLFTYPVLQAADILLYKAEAVPVGEDQIQHIELTREVARKFNARFGDVFPEPSHLVPKEGARILGLDGKAKMSKSLGNYVGLLDPPDETWKKLAPAMTDENRKRRSDPGNPDICNIYSLHRNFSDAETIATVDRECRVAGIGCVDCKKMLHQSLTATIEPIRERAIALEATPGKVEEILDHGAKQAKARAERTMEEVRRAIGVR